MTRKIEGWINVNGGADAYATIEVPDYLPEYEIEERIRKELFSMIDWDWYEVDKND